MKRIFTTVIAFTFAVAGFSQSIHIYEGGSDVTNGTINVTIEASAQYLNDLEIHNTTSSPIDYQVNRTIVGSPIDADAMLYFCTGTQCYSPQSATTWTPVPPPSTIGSNAQLPNGPGTYGIAAHYDVGAVCNDFSVTYRVYNTAAGTTDTAYVTIVYTCEALSAGVEESATGNMYSAYPNPASSGASIKYDMNEYASKGKIVIYDMLGKVAKEIVLSDKQGIVRVDVSEFNPGIYFYAFMVNDKAVSTKKLIVSAK